VETFNTGFVKIYTVHAQNSEAENELSHSENGFGQHFKSFYRQQNITLKQAYSFLVIHKKCKLWVEDIVFLSKYRTDWILTILGYTRWILNGTSQK